MTNVFINGKSLGLVLMEPHYSPIEVKSWLVIKSDKYIEGQIELSEEQHERLKQILKI